jgi:hypothetical protein
VEDPGLSALAAARHELQRVATHILARRRFGASGRFGLRATYGGVGTPAFGDGPETIRIAGLTLVREVGADATRISIVGSTLRELASFADVDLDEAFSCGDDTPELGDTHRSIDLDRESAAVIADWFGLCWRTLDASLATLSPTTVPTTIQLWPEHFDAATTVAVPSGERVNLGFSPGDDFVTEPYVYVGPWSELRPGNPAFWNTSFGAVLRRSDIAGSTDPDEACSEFVRSGLEQFSTA